MISTKRYLTWGAALAWITHKKVCRTCGGTELTRYHRRFWMRWLKGSQLLRCRQCRSTILLLRDTGGTAGDEQSTADRA